MHIFKPKLVKKLILLPVITAIIFLFGIMPVNKIQAAYGFNPDVRQVKTADSPTVYYLDHELGVKKAYLTADAFLSYGNKWSDIKIVSQEQLNKWPDLELIKLAGEKDIYYIKGRNKALIKGPTDFSGFGFSYGKVASVNKTDFLSWQNADYAGIGLITKSGGGPPAGERNAPGALEVEFDFNSQDTDELPLNSRFNLAAVFDLTAAGRTVRVDQITFSLKGVFQAEAVAKVYLTNAADEFLGQPAELNNRKAMFNLSDNPLIIAEGQTEKIKVYLDLASYAEFTNHGLQISIHRAEDILTDAAASGAFPVMAGQYKFMTGDLFGRILVEEIPLNSGREIIIGQSQKIIGKFKISEISGNEDAVLNRIILKNIGDAVAGNLTNFKLKDTFNNLIARAETEDGELVFDLFNFYAVGKGASWTLQLYADISGGEGRSVNFNLSDLYSSGESYGYGLSVDKADDNEFFSITREPVKVFSKDFKPSKLLFSRQRGQIIGNFQLRNNNQKIYLQNVNVSLNKTADAPALNDIVYLVDYDSGEVYSSAQGAKLSGKADLSFNNVRLEAKQQLNFSLLAKLPAGTLSGDKYGVIINKISYNYGGGLTYEDSIGLKGHDLTVTESNLFIYPNDKWDRDYIKGQKNVKIASFIIEAAAGDDAEIWQIILKNSRDSAGSVLYENGFSNLRLYLGGTRVGVISKPVSDSYVFDNIKYGFRAGGRAELSLLADTDAGLKAAEAGITIANLAADSRKSGVASAVFGLNTVSLKAAFSDNIARIRILSAGSFIAGEKDNPVGLFSVTNSGGEDIRLDSVNLVTLGDGFSYSLGFSDLAVAEAGQFRRVGRVARPVAGANKIGLGGFTVKTGQTVEFIIIVRAADNVPLQGFEAYLSQLAARGKKSNLQVKVLGDPSDFIVINASAPVGDDSGGEQAVSLSWPVDSVKVNYGFHDPNYPFRDQAGEHNAIDIDLSQGSAVKAAADGTVVALANNNTAAYNYLTIDHGQGIKTTYGHLSAVKVELGDSVKRGQAVALSGGQPGAIGAGSNTNGAHLHFEVSQNGVDVDPMEFLK